MGPLSKKNNYPKEYCLKEYFLHVSMALFLSTLYQLWAGLCTSPAFGWHNPSHGWALNSTESTWFKIISLNFPPQRTGMQGRLRPNGKILYVFAPESKGKQTSIGKFGLFTASLPRHQLSPCAAISVLAWHRWASAQPAAPCAPELGLLRWQQEHSWLNDFCWMLWEEPGLPFVSHHLENLTSSKVHWYLSQNKTYTLINGWVIILPFSSIFSSLQKGSYHIGLYQISCKIFFQCQLSTVWLVLFNKLKAHMNIFYLFFSSFLPGHCARVHKIIK